MCTEALSRETFAWAIVKWIILVWLMFNETKLRMNTKRLQMNLCGVRVRCRWHGYIMMTIYQMGKFSALLAFCAGIHWSPVNSPHKGQWCSTLMFSLMFSLICVWTNGRINTRDVDDLIRHRIHYDAARAQWNVVVAWYQWILRLCTKLCLRCTGPIQSIIITLMPEQNDRHFADDIFKSIF